MLRLILAVGCVSLAATAGPANAKPSKPRSTPTRQAAPAGKGAARAAVTFGIGAASAKGLDPRRDHLNFLTDPGSQIGDHIVLVNLGYRPLTIAVYTADALNAANGTIAYDPRASPGREARAWISVDGRGPSLDVAVPARGSKVLPIAVKVPATATPGDHVVGIMASVTSKVTTTTGQNPRLEQRIALRAFFRVSGLLKPQLSITHLHAAYAGTANPIGAGTATVSYVVTNTGNVDLGGKQAIKISGLFGSSGSLTSTPRVPLLLPGGSFPVRVLIHHVWPEVLMHAKVTVTPLGASGAVNPELKPLSAETSFWAVPWTLLIFVVLIMAVAETARRWRRAHPPAARHRPAPGTRTPVAAGRI